MKTIRSLNAALVNPKYFVFQFIIIGLLVSTRLTGQAYPPVTCCNPCPQDASLIANGNFSDLTNNGLSQFSTDLNFSPVQNIPPLNSGDFTVCTNASSISPSRSWNAISHTPDGSMVFFGLSNGIANRTWYQQVQVTNGRRYCFS